MKSNPILLQPIMLAIVNILAVLPLSAQHNYFEHALTIQSSYGVDMVTPTNESGRNFLYGLQVSYDRGIANTDQEWVRVLNAKNISFGLLWHNMTHMRETVDNQDYPNGHAIGVLTTVDFQLLETGGVKFLFIPGLGLTYITETISTQPATSTVGSHLNISLAAKLGMEVPLSDRLSLLAGVNVLHYSNAGIKIPNGGINTLNGFVGLKTALNSKLLDNTHTTSKKTAFHHLPGGSAEIVVGMGRRGKYRSAGGFYRTGLYAGYNYHINQVIGFKAGLDMVYYHSVFDIDRFDETFQYYGSSYDNVRFGGGLGMDIAMGRFAVNGLLGRYIHYNSFHENINWYWTAGFRYYITRNIGFQTTLYMHRVQADFLNWGLVFKI